ncbi:hypothetical protein [Cellulosilyticum sp. I15G10I2]|uniref:hypothetical protein n=1 Tax=Cellulosilyticum sp. I15G10I2 TaxID=1892843 RepID=UPI00085C7D64|nr:hypothetical protein [Cellulosilyticum sp. I15G10I2]
MKISIKKSEVPIIWLDTFAIIRFTKILLAEKVSEVEKERYTSLFQLLTNKIKSKKLICVKGEQIEEIKLGGRLVDECNGVLIQLSLGVNTKPLYEIERSQL